MKNPTINNFKINSLSEQRWSPRAFSAKPVEKQKLQSILEAGRWAPSAYNEQPWRFIVGQLGDDTYGNILSTLVDWNKLWAAKAPVFILNLAKKTFTHNGTQNVTFKYDLGQAVGIMTLEAVNQGLYTHQMSGFEANRAAELFNIPNDFQAVSVTAIGYYGATDELPKDMVGMEKNPRERNDIKNMAFGNKFGESLDL